VVGVGPESEGRGQNRFALGLCPLGWQFQFLGGHQNRMQTLDSTGRREKVVPLVTRAQRDWPDIAVGHD
jgi:hypothetical protein